ncbi:hypothetical protein [Prauserella halophila]|nr:hypothetical protein [Prauserella halophila]
MLHRTQQLGQVTGARTDDELARCFHVGAHDGADVLHLPRVDFTSGSPADFVLVHGECLPQIVVDTPPPELVVHGGRVVARNGEPAGADEEPLREQRIR